jgi:hypothetical protein
MLLMAVVMKMMKTMKIIELEQAGRAPPHNGLGRRL